MATKASYERRNIVIVSGSLIALGTGILTAAPQGINTTGIILLGLGVALAVLHELAHRKDGHEHKE